MTINYLYMVKEHFKCVFKYYESWSPNSIYSVNDATMSNVKSKFKLNGFYVSGWQLCSVPGHNDISNIVHNWL